MTDESSIPYGYVRHDRRSPLTDPWEPLLARWQSTDFQLAVQLREAHCNSRGFAHGGLVAALADNAMGYSAVSSSQVSELGAKSAVTLSLTLDYLDSARRGELLEFCPRVLRCGKLLSFVECKVVVGDRLVARASATFRMS